MRGVLTAILSAGALAACATTTTDAPPTSMTSADEDVDLFALAIEAERYSYIVTLAYEGSIEGRPIVEPRDETFLERATDALHDGVRELYFLREEVCTSGLAAPEHCGPLPPPDWFGEPVGSDVDVAEIRRRIDWLTEAMGPFVEAGCDAGQSVQPEGYPYYCSVE